MQDLIQVGYYIQKTISSDVRGKTMCAYLHYIYPTIKEAEEALNEARDLGVYRDSRHCIYSIVPVYISKSRSKKNKKKS